jgi:hypothetical protein
MKIRSILLLFLPLLAQEQPIPLMTEEIIEPKVSVAQESPNEKKWYFELKPGYYYLTDSTLREIYNQGGFTCRVEAGYKVWGPLILWFDGGYFQKEGQALGGDEGTRIMLGSLTLGLKWIHYFHERVALYAGAGPRLFLVKVHNFSPYVRGEDNDFGIGGGFNAGFWFFPIPCWPNFFLDLFADYSLMKVEIEEDEISSYDYDLDVSGTTVGLGLGFRF